MPQQSNESSATPRPWIKVPQGDGSFVIAREFLTGKQMAPRGLRIIALVMVRRDSLVEDEANADLIFTAVNAYDENQATIKDLQERLEKQGKVIKDLVKALEHIANFEGYLCDSAKGYKKHCQKALNSIPKEFL